MYLQPSNIFYSQDSINNVFDKRCNHSYKPIGETLDEICEGKCSVDDIPKITVVLMNGKWITADNRRLWVFRQLERLGKCDKVFVKKGYCIPESKLTSENDGLTVRVRGPPGGYWHRKSSATKQRTNTSISSGHKSIYDFNSHGITTQNVATKPYQTLGYGINVKPVYDSRDNKFNIQKHSIEQRGSDNYSRTNLSQYNYPNEGTVQGTFNRSHRTVCERQSQNTMLITAQPAQVASKSYGTDTNRQNQSSTRSIARPPHQEEFNNYGSTFDEKNKLQVKRSSKSSQEHRMIHNKVNDRQSEPKVNGILRNGTAADTGAAYKTKDMYTAKNTGCCIIL